MSKKNIQIKIDTAIETSNSVKTISELKKSINELTRLQKNIGDKSSEDYGRVSKAISDTNVKLAQIAINNIKNAQSVTEYNKAMRVAAKLQENIGDEGSSAWGMLDDTLNDVNDNLVNAALNGAKNAKTMGELRKAMVAIQDVQATLGDTTNEYFDDLQEANSELSRTMGETKGFLNEINDRVSTLNGSPIERMNKSVGLLKKGLLNLDFDKAKIGAEGLMNAMTPVVDGKMVTGLSGIGGAFKNLTGVVSKFGSTLITMGKALLTNPIFLIGAIIAGIVIGIVKLLDVLGLLKPIIDGIGKAIGFVVNAFKSLTDWIGITAHAEEDAAKKSKKINEERRKDIEKLSELQKKYSEHVYDATEDEIAQIEKLLGMKITFNKNQHDIEAERLRDTEKTLNDELSHYNAILKKKGKLNEEDASRFKELNEQRQDVISKANQNEVDRILYKTKLVSKIEGDLESLRINNSTNERERSIALIELDRKRSLSALEADKKRLESYGLSTDIIDKSIEELNNKFDNEILKTNKEYNKKSLDAKKEAVKNNLSELEKSLKIEINKTDENTAERLKAELDYIDKVLEFKKNNAKLLGLNEKDITLLIQESTKERKKLEDGYNNYIISKANEISDLKMNIDKLNNNNLIYNLNNQMKLTKEAYLKEVNALGLTNEQKEVINNNYYNYLKEKSNEMISLMKVNADNEIKSIESDYETKIKLAGDDNDLITLLEQEKAIKIKAINDKLSNDIIDINKSTTEEVVDNTNKALLELTNNISNYGNSLSNAFNFSNVSGNINILQVAFQDLSNSIGPITNNISNIIEGLGDKTINVAKAVAAGMATIANLGASIIQAQIEENAILSEQKLNELSVATEKEKSLLDEQYSNALISKEEYDNSMTELLKTSSKKELDIKKKAFEEEKKAKVSNAIMETIAGSAMAFLGAMSLPFPANFIVGGLSAAAATAFGVANIANIKKQKFQGGDSTSSNTPSAPSSSTGDIQNNFTPENFYSLGSGLPYGNNNGTNNNSENYSKVYVTETDITNIQNKVKVIEESTIF